MGKTYKTYEDRSFRRETDWEELYDGSKHGKTSRIKRLVKKTKRERISKIQSERILKQLTRLTGRDWTMTE